MNRRQLVRGTLAMGLLSSLGFGARARAALPVGTGWINLYCTVRDLPDVEFPTVELKRRDLSDPALRPHLRGLEGWIFSQIARAPTRAQAHAIEHVWKVQHHVWLKATPDQAAAVSEWARAANALAFFEDQTLRNPDGDALVGPGASATADAPYPADARARRERIRADLAGQGFQTPESMPPVVGEAELRLRPADVVRARALGLAQVAVRGESAASGDPIPAADLEARLPGALLTDRERAFLKERKPRKDEIVQLTWRYEGLWTLLWALGKADLSHPPALCDAATAMRGAFALADDKAPVLRDAGEILDAMDRHYRLHWAVRDAELNGRALPGVDGGVVVERRTALAWLASLGDFDWEEIQLPT